MCSIDRDVSEAHSTKHLYAKQYFKKDSFIRDVKI